MAINGFEGIMEAYARAHAPWIVLSIAAAVFLLAWRGLRVQLDPLEPPPLKPRIPVLGHIMGMIRYHSMYFEKLQ